MVKLQIIPPDNKTSMGFSVMLWGAEFWFLPNIGAFNMVHPFDQQEEMG